MALLQKVDSADGSSVFDHLAQVVLKVRRLHQAAHICMQHACMQGTTRSKPLGAPARSWRTSPTMQWTCWRRLC